MFDWFWQTVPDVKMHAKKILKAYRQDLQDRAQQTKLHRKLITQLADEQLSVEVTIVCVPYNLFSVIAVTLLSWRDGE